MKQSFFFYDLETSGLDPRAHRIMQFAGIRTDMELKPIGEPINVLVRLSDDILPDPGAIMVTGITPQQTLADGISEREFCKLFTEELAKPGTIVTGFNSIRFDDEFIRHTLWRNFYDPYEWAWADDRSRWDMLDVVRMTRALRPEGIEWPVVDGKSVNKLELLAAANSLDHTKAHDALSDVEVLIGMARLVRDKQPKLFTYLLEMRNKRSVEKLVNLEHPEPFVYASGRYGGEFDYTTVGFPICAGSKPGSVVIYDLRYDPGVFASLSLEQIRERLFGAYETRKELGKLPLKELSYNKSPAVAPLGVLDDAAQKRLKLDLQTVAAHKKTLLGMTDFGLKVREAFKTREPYPQAIDVEGRLYDSFVDAKDKGRMAVIREADTNELADFHPTFSDERLPELLLRYKGRQFAESLSDDERVAWETYRNDKLRAQLPAFAAELQALAATVVEDESKRYLLEELHLWGESILPADID